MTDSWAPDPALARVSPAAVAALEEHWDRGWNDRDLDVIMEPFADDVVFRSPFVPRISGDPAVSAIVGYAAVRQYVADSFVRAPAEIRYTLHRSFAGPDGVVLLYTVHHPSGDKAGADTMVLDAAGKVVEWRSHYPFAD